MNLAHRDNVLAEADLLLAEAGLAAEKNPALAKTKRTAAKILLTDLVDAYRNDIDALVRLATACSQLGDTSGAKPHLAKVLELAPWHIDARAALAKIEAAERGPGPPMIPVKIRYGTSGALSIAAAVVILFPIAASIAFGDSGQTKVTICDVSVGLPADAEESPSPSASPSPTASPLSSETPTNEPTQPQSPTPTKPPTEAPSPPPTEPPGESPSPPPSPSSTAVPTRSVLGKPCEEESASKVTITDDDPAAPTDIRAAYLGIAGALAAAALLIFLLPFIKKLDAGPISVEVDTGPSPPTPAGG